MSRGAAAAPVGLAKGTHFPSRQTLVGAGPARAAAGRLGAVREAGVAERGAGRRLAGVVERAAVGVGTAEGVLGVPQMTSRVLGPRG
jgi:hypothetical protein